MTVGERVKYRRIELHMSQEELANKANYCGKSAVSRLENSGNDISMKQVKRLSEALDCSMAYLMGWENAPDVQEALNKNDVEKKVEEQKVEEQHTQSPGEGFVNISDLPKAMDLFAKYQNASPEVRVAVDLLLKSQQQDALSQRLQDYSSAQIPKDS